MRQRRWSSLALLLTWGEGHSWAGGPSAPGHIEFRSLC